MENPCKNPDTEERKKITMSTRNRHAMSIALVAGVLLIISGINGIATWETIKEFVTNNVIDNSVVQLVFATLIFIASLGGIAVLIGGVFIGKNLVRKGKLLIALGAGLGLVGLLVTLGIAYTEDNLLLGEFFCTI